MAYALHPTPTYVAPGSYSGFWARFGRTLPILLMGAGLAILANFAVPSAFDWFVGATAGSGDGPSLLDNGLAWVTNNGMFMALALAVFAVVSFVFLTNSALYGFWARVGSAFLILMMGAGLAVAAFLAVPPTFGWLIGATAGSGDTPSLIETGLAWVANTGWFHWASAIVAALIVAVGSFMFVEDEVPIDLAEYFVVTLRGAILTAIVSSVWVALHVTSFGLIDLSLVMAAAFMLSAVVIAVCALLDI